MLSRMTLLSSALPLLRITPISCIPPSLSNLFFHEISQPTILLCTAAQKIPIFATLSCAWQTFVPLGFLCFFHPIRFCTFRVLLLLVARLSDSSIRSPHEQDPDVSMALLFVCPSWVSLQHQNHLVPAVLLPTCYSRRSQFERFQPFLELFSRLQFEFCRRGNFSNKQFDFSCVWGSFTQNVTVHVHVLWLVFTRVLIRCRHTADTHTQTTYAAQTHHASFQTGLASLMTHDNIYVCTYMSVNVYPCVFHGYVCMCVCVYVCMYVCICVYKCRVFFVLSGPDRWRTKLEKRNVTRTPGGVAAPRPHVFRHGVRA